MGPMAKAVNIRVTSLRPESEYLFANALLKCYLLMLMSSKISEK